MTTWKKVAPLLIVFSIGLNIAFVGIWFTNAAMAGRVNQEPCGRTCEGVSCPLHRNLNVTDEQWGELEPRLTQFQTESQSLCLEIRRLSGELIDLIALPQPDTNAITAKQEEILVCQRKMQEYVIAHLLAEKQTLTEEQQAKLFYMIKEKAGCAAGNGAVCPVSTNISQGHGQKDILTEQ
jgi:Spy/CpxP family protein refolding chaperone